MSAALVRQALEFVDQDSESGKKKNSSKKTHKSTSSAKKDRHIPYQYKPKVTRPAKVNLQSPSVEDKVAELLQLSAGVTDTNITDKIIARAVKGTPLSDYIPVPRDKAAESRSILFPEESYKNFEEELFCS